MDVQFFENTGNEAWTEEICLLLRDLRLESHVWPHGSPVFESIGTADVCAEAFGCERAEVLAHCSLILSVHPLPTSTSGIFQLSSNHLNVSGVYDRRFQGRAIRSLPCPLEIHAASTRGSRE
jgi:hypothetical protein